MQADTNPQAPNADASDPIAKHSDLFNEDGTLKTAAELADVHPKQKKQKQPKAPKVQAEPKTKPEPKAKELRPICTKRKKDNTACTARCMAVKGEIQDFCTDHRPAHMHLTDDEMDRVVAMLESVRDSGTLAERIVQLMGWGQVREAIRGGRL